MKTKIAVLKRSARLGLGLCAVLWCNGLLPLLPGNPIFLSGVIPGLLSAFFVFAYFLWMREEKAPRSALRTVACFSLGGMVGLLLFSLGIQCFFSEQTMGPMLVSNSISQGIFCLVLFLCLGVGEFLLALREKMAAEESKKRAWRKSARWCFLFLILITVILLFLSLLSIAGESSEPGFDGPSRLVQLISFRLVPIFGAILILYEILIWRFVGRIPSGDYSESAKLSLDAGRVSCLLCIGIWPFVSFPFLYLTYGMVLSTILLLLLGFCILPWAFQKYETRKINLS